ncbi:MAG: hypothetical protein AAF990_28730 [Bacteroidota bacterium]
MHKHQKSSGLRSAKDTPFVCHLDQVTYFDLDHMESDVGITAYQLGFECSFDTLVNDQKVCKAF